LLIEEAGWLVLMLGATYGKEKKRISRKDHHQVCGVVNYRPIDRDRRGTYVMHFRNGKGKTALESKQVINATTEETDNGTPNTKK